MEEYRFLYDYIVLDKRSLNRYMEKFHNTSAIWGQFLHKEQDRLRSHIREVSQIVAVSDIELPTMYHNEIATRLIKEPFAFERFLKNYHLIELLFDYDLVNNIKDLDDDLKGIGKLLSQYNSKEFNRLIYVLGGRINSIPSLEVQLNNIDNFMSKAKVIFMIMVRTTTH
ncbi:hypothetical protein ABIE27_003141 [Paenibacillus sp. 4624]|uniref:hypothetical protein n=1 Tax=Paenibacillus sp. 4624 TaxID=3156453 RepID=UPI003D235F55